MAQWYAQVGGQRFGPVTEEELRSWIQQGRVKPSDYVWSEGMANWIPASTAFGIASPNAGYAYASAQLLVAPPPGGTGGQTPNTTLMSQAWEAMSGRWGIAIGFSVLWGLLEIGINMVPYIGGLALLILAGALELGGCIFYLNYSRRGRYEIGNLFSGFKWFGTTLGTYLLISLFVFLWTLLLIVPGIIAALAYSQAFFILGDRPGIGVMDAIRESKKMMNGHKWKLFCLGLWFFLLTLACAFTLFIGLFWLIPYQHVTLVKFYDDLAVSPQALAQPATAPI